jgi:hypothetical protein
MREAKVNKAQQNKCIMGDVGLIHFLFICSKYNKLRLVLLDSIQELIPKNNNADINIGLCYMKIDNFVFILYQYCKIIMFIHNL